MKYIILLIIVIITILYAIVSFVERYKLKKKNEELKDRYELMKKSIEKEGVGARAKYRIAHESEKIDRIKSSLRSKYGDRLIMEKQLLDEILEYESRKAELLEVDFSVKKARNAENLLLELSEDDSISFFLNLIDNALEAAVLSEEKRVEITIGRDITLINSKLRESLPEDYRLGSSKEDKYRHGFGMDIIDQVVSEHGLKISYEDEGNRLITSISFPAEQGWEMPGRFRRGRGRNVKENDVRQ